MKKKIVLTIIICTAIIAFFYPKQSGYTNITIAGYQGEKHCGCFGFKVELGQCWPGFCTDSGTKDYCFGIPSPQCECRIKNPDSASGEDYTKQTECKL